MEVLCVTRLGPRILTWFLYFWNVCVLLVELMLLFSQLAGEFTCVFKAWWLNASQDLRYCILSTGRIYVLCVLHFSKRQPFPVQVQRLGFLMNVQCSQ